MEEQYAKKSKKRKPSKLQDAPISIIKKESSKFVEYLFNNNISLVPFCFLFKRL